MQQVIRGRGSLTGATVATLMRELGMVKPLLVCGKRMTEVFRARVGIDLPVFSGYHPNPDLVDCQAGAAMYRDMGCDGLISLGGGSAMDTAKAIKALVLTGDMARVKASDLPEAVQLPHIAIPGTAGTGSEATPFAVVYVDGRKLSLDHPSLLPEAVVLDSSLLDTLPDYHKRACAMDALSQGIESFWAKKATQESRVHAEKAIRGVLGSITAYLAGDAAAQDAMLEAAYESGSAIAISRTTAAHAMSYQVTQCLGYAHGHACMLLLHGLVADIADRLDDGRKAPSLQPLAEIFGVEDGWGIARVLLGLLAELDMLPEKAAYGTLLDELAAGVDTKRLKNHPVQMTKAFVRTMYARTIRPLLPEAKEAYAAIWRAYDQENAGRGALHPRGDGLHLCRG